MVFGDSTDAIDISINGNMVEQVDTQKYLGVMLDPQLNFSLQADFAVSKVKRAAAKVSLLYDGREGIPLQTENSDSCVAAKLQNRLAGSVATLYEK